MKITSSKFIQEAVNIKQDRKAQLQRLANDSVTTGSRQVYIDGMKKAAALAPNNNTEIFVAILNKSVLIFSSDKDGGSWDEDALHEAIMAIPDRQHIPTPRKVLLKMCILRMKKIRKFLYGKPSRPNKKPPPNISLSSKQECIDVINAFKVNLTPYEEDRLKDIMSFFNEARVTDDVVKEAWDLTEVNDVLSA